MSHVQYQKYKTTINPINIHVSKTIAMPAKPSYHRYHLWLIKHFTFFYNLFNSLLIAKLRWAVMFRGEHFRSLKIYILSYTNILVPIRFFVQKFFVKNHHNVRSESYGSQPCGTFRQSIQPGQGTAGYGQSSSTRPEVRTCLFDCYAFF